MLAYCQLGALAQPPPRPIPAGPERRLPFTSTNPPRTQLNRSRAARLLILQRAQPAQAPQLRQHLPLPQIACAAPAAARCAAGTHTASLVEPLSCGGAGGGICAEAAGAARVRARAAGQARHRHRAQAQRVVQARRGRLHGGASRASQGHGPLHTSHTGELPPAGLSAPLPPAEPSHAGQRGERAQQTSGHPATAALPMAVV